MRLEWKPMALTDRENIMGYISQNNPQAAIDLDDEFETAAERACSNPDMYKPGRIKGTGQTSLYSGLPDGSGDSYGFACSSCRPAVAASNMTEISAVAAWNPD